MVTTMVTRPRKGGLARVVYSVVFVTNFISVFFPTYSVASPQNKESDDSEFHVCSGIHNAVVLKTNPLSMFMRFFSLFFAPLAHIFFKYIFFPIVSVESQ